MLPNVTLISYLAGASCRGGATLKNRSKDGPRTDRLRSLPYKGKLVPNLEFGVHSMEDFIGS